MISRRSIRSWVAAQLFLFVSLPAIVLSQGIDNNPTGPTGVYNGNITTAGNYDPSTGNQMRIVDDLVVPGSVGAYPLKWTRYSNTRAQLPIDGPWTFSYTGYRITDTWAKLPDGRQLGAPWVEEKAGAAPGDCSTPWSCGTIVLADGGRVEFEQQIVLVAPVPPSDTQSSYHVYRPIEVIDPYGQITKLTYVTRGFYKNTTVKNPSPIYVLDKVTEPGGRYLQLTWQDFPTNPDTPAISKVEAFDGQGNSLGWVNYTWVASSDQNGIFQILTHVDYSDGTFANYTYGDLYLGSHLNASTLFTADDVRYDGPMRQIAYGRKDSTGQLVPSLSSESNLNTHELLTIAWFDGSDQHQLPDGTWSMTYQREKETRADGATRTFTYQAICTWTHPATETMECDGNNGKLIGYTDFLGHTTQITYYPVDVGTPADGFIHTVTDPNGLTTTYTRGDSWHWGITRIDYPDGSFINQTYTDQYTPYYLASRTLQAGPNDPVRTITYTRDGNHRITRKDYPDGGWEEFDYNPLGEVTAHRRCKDGTNVESESFQYDGRGLKTHYTDATGGTTDYAYYTSGPWTDRLLTITYPANASGVRASETYEYDRAYDANGQNSGAPSGSPIAGRGLVTKITHADGSYKLFSYNKYGDKLWEEDELRQRTNYSYDEYGRVVTVNTPLNHTTTNSYVPTACGSASSSSTLCVSSNSTSTLTTSKLPFSTTLPSGKQTTFEYDPNWRKRFVHVAPGTADAATTESRYDEGNANVGHLTTMVDPKGNATTYGYDLRDRQTSVTDAANHTSRVVYDTRGVKISETHANNELIEYDGYDAMNRLTHKKVHRDANTIDQVSIGYDCAGNQIATVDENGNSYAYSFDNMNRPTVMTYPNGKTEVHAYDAAGNVQTYTNRSAAAQTFSYDNRNRQINFTWSDGTSSQTTAYDSASRKIEIDNADATITLAYDAENHLTTQTEKEITSGVGDNVARTVTYGYDADGNRGSVTYPSGTVLNYDYTQRNQVAAIKDASNRHIVDYTFDLSGNIRNRGLDNGTSSAYSVDQVNRDTSVAHSLNGTNRKFEYAYNSVNDITVVKRDGGLGDGYKYDLTQQITEFQQDAVVDLNSGTATNPAKDNTMTFDGCGNRTMLNAVPESYNNMNQPNDVAHDNDGNVQSRGGVNYTYDAQNRLRQAGNAAISIAFYYDGLNRQVARTISGLSPTGSPTPSPSPIVVPTVSPLPSASPLPTVGSTPTVPPIYTPTVPPVTTPTPPGAGQCAPVTYSQPSKRTVQMSTATSGATIFYTTDGTTPSHNGSTPTGTTQTYSGPIGVGGCSETFFEAIAYKVAMSDSDVTTYDVPPDSTCSGSGGGSTVTVFSIWDGDWAVLEEYNGSGIRIQGYVQGYHGLVKTIVDNIYYYQDELGSTSHISDSHGTLLEYYKYNLYGKPSYYDGNGNQLTATNYNVVDLGNGGSRWIPALGLYDDRNRFMSPDLGRFLQPDPIGFKGDASNLYRYCGNDWANKSDPMGLLTEQAGSEKGRDTTQDVPYSDNSPWAEIEKDQLNATVYAPTANAVERATQRGRLARETAQKAVDAAKEAERLSEQQATHGTRGDILGKNMEERRIDGFVNPNTGHVETTGYSKGSTGQVGAWNKHFAPAPKLPNNLSEKYRVFQAFSHVPGSGYHERGDLISANDQAHGGDRPLVSAIALTADRGRTVQLYVPSSSVSERLRLAGGKFFYTENGNDFRDHY